MNGEMARNLTLVTGATGFVAGHVVQQLLQAGYPVRGTVRDLKNEKKIKPLRELHPEANSRLELVEADLLDEQSWTAAVKGCRYVIHLASPNPLVNPRDQSLVIKPAVDGTLNVLRACHAAGTVRRVVLTSSIVAVADFDYVSDQVITEEVWTEVKDNTPAYTKSKTMAELAAWSFVRGFPAGEIFELATINPGYIQGPALSDVRSASMNMISEMLENSTPFWPALNFALIDVRDVAKAHLRAMVIPEAAGNRHIVAGNNIWITDIGKILDKEFRHQGYPISTRTAPSFLVHIWSLFNKRLRELVPALGVVRRFDTSRMSNVLGVTPIHQHRTVIDMAYSLIERGIVPKRAAYKGPSPDTGFM